MLPNYLLLVDNAFYCRAGFVDSFDETGNLKQREWRGLVVGNGRIVTPKLCQGSCYPNQVVKMRNAIFEFVICEEGSVSWQEQHVTGTEYF